MKFSDHTCSWPRLHDSITLHINRAKFSFTITLKFGRLYLLKMVSIPFLHNIILASTPPTPTSRRIPVHPNIARVEILAGHQTMSGLIGDLTDQFLILLVMLTGHMHNHRDKVSVLLVLSACTLLYVWGSLTCNLISLIIV